LAGRSPLLQVGVSLLAEDGRVRWVRPAGDEGECPPGYEMVDAGGTTIVPGRQATRRTGVRG